MDTITFKVKPIDMDGKEFPFVDIYINDRNLIDIVSEIELPYATHEGHPDIAGGYMGLSPNTVFFPSRHFLGGHMAEISDTQKTEIFACGSCGEVGCWPLLVQISVHENIVVWHDFEQPYRDKDSRVSHWQYDKLGPFVFDKEQYLSALTRQQ